MVYSVYILYSEKFDKIYIGFTSNLIERFKSHNSLSLKGHTIKFRPWKVIYTELYETKSYALIREKQLKSGKGRKWIRETLKRTGEEVLFCNFPKVSLQSFHSSIRFKVEVCTL